MPRASYKSDIRKGEQLPILGIVDIWNQGATCLACLGNDLEQFQGNPHVVLVRRGAVFRCGGLPGCIRRCLKCDKTLDPDLEGLSLEEANERVNAKDEACRARRLIRMGWQQDANGYWTHPEHHPEPVDSGNAAVAQYTHEGAYD
jgi:hypothetical protein